MTLLLLLACASPDDSAPSSDCIADHPRTGDPAVDFPDRDPDAAAAECAAKGGADCDASAFLPQAAIECRALEEGLAAGLHPWTYSLPFHHDHLTVVWNVQNVTYEEPGKEGGDWLQFHATTGELLQRGGWQGME